MGQIGAMFSRRRDSLFPTHSTGPFQFRHFFKSEAVEFLLISTDTIKELGRAWISAKMADRMFQLFILDIACFAVASILSMFWGIQAGRASDFTRDFDSVKCPVSTITVIGGPHARNISTPFQEKTCIFYKDTPWDLKVGDPVDVDKSLVAAACCFWAMFVGIALYLKLGNQ